MPNINYDELDPGIRDLVQLLNDAGFETTDSGDGSKAEHMECALPFPMVTVVVTRESLCDEADRLAALLVEKEYEGWVVEASYSPGGTSLVMAMKQPYEDIISNLCG